MARHWGRAGKGLLVTTERSFAVMKQNRTNLADRDRQASAGIKLHYANVPTLVLDGVSYAQADVVKILQDLIDLAGPAIAAATAFHAAVAAEKSAITKANAVYLALKGRVLSDFKSQPQVLADFGITLPTRQVPSAVTAAEAVAKRAATRAARHTLGKRQKAKITGTVPATPPPAPKPQV